MEIRAGAPIAKKVGQHTCFFFFAYLANVFLNKQHKRLLFIFPVFDNPRIIEKSCHNLKKINCWCIIVYINKLFDFYLDEVKKEKNKVKPFQEEPRVWF